MTGLRGGRHLRGKREKMSKAKRDTNKGGGRERDF